MVSLQLGWSIALGPWKQLPLNLFVLWMAGNSISLFPIMMVGMMFVRPVQTLFSYKEGKTVRTLLSLTCVISFTCCLPHLFPLSPLPLYICYLSFPLFLSPSICYFLPLSIFPLSLPCMSPYSVPSFPLLTTLSIIPIYLPLFPHSLSPPYLSLSLLPFPTPNHLYPSYLIHVTPPSLQFSVV